MYAYMNGVYIYQNHMYNHHQSFTNSGRQKGEVLNEDAQFFSRLCMIHFLTRLCMTQTHCGARLYRRMKWDTASKREE